MQKHSSSKLRFGTLLSYGIGAIGEGIGYNVFFSFFSFSYSSFIRLIVTLYSSLKEEGFPLREIPLYFDNRSIGLVKPMI